MDRGQRKEEMKESREAGLRLPIMVDSRASSPSLGLGVCVVPSLPAPSLSLPLTEPLQPVDAVFGALAGIEGLRCAQQQLLQHRLVGQPCLGGMWVGVC